MGELGMVGIPAAIANAASASREDGLAAAEASP
jgi:hypothetical protein